MSRFKAREDILAREQSLLKNRPARPREIATFESIGNYLQVCVDYCSFVECICLEFTFVCAASHELACCSFYVI